MARRRMLRIGATALALVLLAGGVAAWALTRPDPAAAAGCTPVQTVEPMGRNMDRIHIGSQGGPEEMPPLTEYSSRPPTSGPHADQPLSAGVYEAPPPVAQVIHSLEHGAVVVWYSPRTSDPELEQIKNFYSEPENQDHVIVAPFDYPREGAAGSLPDGRSVAVAAWHRLQLCDDVSLKAVQSFVDRFRVPTGGPAPPGYPRDGAPEAGAAI